MLKVANLLENAIEFARFLKTFKIWVFYQKKDGFFRKKILTVLKMAKGSKFAVECDWISKNFRNVQSWKLSFFNKKQMRLSRKVLSFFKISKVRNFDLECDWNSMNFQNVQSWNFGFFFKKKMSLSKKSWIFYKMLKVASLLENAIEFARFLKTFKIWVFYQKKDGFFRKKSWRF